MGETDLTGFRRLPPSYQTRIRDSMGGTDISRVWRLQGVGESEAEAPGPNRLDIFHTER